MGQEPKSSPKRASGGKPAPSATAPAPVIQDKKKAANVDLITFKPTLVDEGVPPASENDAAFLFQRILRRWTHSLGALALVCFVLLVGPGLYRDFKAWRATALALEGEKLARENQTEAAILTIHSAFILSPDAPEVLRAMAQLFTAYELPGAMNYWNWLLQSTDATDGDRRAAADCAMQNELYNEAWTLIQGLLARDGKDARNQFLAARWCAQRGTPVETMSYATRAVNDDPTDKAAVLFLAGQELANNYLRQEGIDTLFQLAGSDDDAGLTALQRLNSNPDLKPDEIDRLIARLKSHPLAGETGRVAALALEIKRHPGRRETLIDQAVAAHQNGAPADLAIFAEWLATHGEAERVLKLIPREKALSNKDIFASYIDALGRLNRWAEIKTLLSGTTVPLEIPFVELYLARCASEMDDEQESDLHWQSAVSAAAYNPAQSLYLATYAEKIGWNERAAAAYRTLTQEPVTARLSYLGLLRVLPQRDARSLRDTLQQMVARWPNDDDIATQYVFFNLLLNERVLEMRQRAASLLADDSYSISHHTNMALACIRLKDPIGALKEYHDVSIDWNTAPLPDLVVYAAALHANGADRTAHQLLLSVDRRKLPTELHEIIGEVP